MNLLEAIQLYCHIMQQSGGGYDARKIAFNALIDHKLAPPVVEAIAQIVSNDGNLFGKDGGRFAITQIAAS